MANVALYTARTGLDTAQQWMDQISNSAANVKSLAFKDTYLQITDLSYTQLKQAGVQQSQETFETPIGYQRGNGSKVVGTSRIMTQGPLKQTNVPLDLAIRGGGYFAVNIPTTNGFTVGYTRVGKFSTTKTGQVVTSDGYELKDSIVIDQTKYNLGDVSIANDGTVTVLDRSQNPATTVQLGQIQLWVFPNDQGAQDIGNGIMIQTDASGDPVQETPGQNNTGSIMQGNLEQSNVNSVEVMTGLIEAQHIYELNTKIIMAVNDMEKNTNNMYKS